MFELKIVYCIASALAEFLGIYFLTKKFVQINKGAKVVFYALFFAYEIYNIANNMFAFGRNEIKLLCMVAVGGIFLLGSSKKELWNLIYFYCNVLILRSLCQLFKFIFITFYSGAKMEMVMKNLREYALSMAFFYLVFYIPGFFLSKYLWKQLILCETKLFHGVCLAIMILLFGMEMFSEWIQILITMPTLILLLVVIAVFRIEVERVESHKLEFYIELENQMKEMDKELEEIRSEVEKYYKRAGETSADYAEQLLERIEHAKGE